MLSEISKHLFVDAFFGRTDENVAFYVHSLTGRFSWLHPIVSGNEYLDHLQRQVRGGELTVQGLMVDPAMAKEILENLERRERKIIERAVEAACQSAGSPAQTPPDYVRLESHLQRNYAYFHGFGDPDIPIRAAFEPHVVARRLGRLTKGPLRGPAASGAHAAPTDSDTPAHLTDQASGHHQFDAGGYRWVAFVQGRMWGPLQETFSDLFFSSDDPVVFFDPTGNITRSNKAARALLEPPQDPPVNHATSEMRGVNLADLLVHDEDRYVFREKVKSTARLLGQLKNVHFPPGGPPKPLAERLRDLETIKDRVDVLHFTLRCNDTVESDCEDVADLLQQYSGGTPQLPLRREVCRVLQIKVGLVTIDMQKYEAVRFSARIHRPRLQETFDRMAGMGEPAWREMLKAARQLPADIGEHLRNPKDGGTKEPSGEESPLSPRSKFHRQRVAERALLRDLRNPRPRELVVLHADMADFGTIIGLLDRPGGGRRADIAQQVTLEFVQRFHLVMAREIQREHGFVVKFIGDAILAVFGLVDDYVDSRLQMFNELMKTDRERLRDNLRRHLSPRQAYALPHKRAINAALAIRHQYAALRGELSDCMDKKLPLIAQRQRGGMRVTLHAGSVSAGDFGPEAYMMEEGRLPRQFDVLPTRPTFDLLGDAVNLTFRMQQHTNENEIIVSHTIKTRFDAHSIAGIRLAHKGDFALKHMAGTFPLYLLEQDFDPHG